MNKIDIATKLNVAEAVKRISEKVGTTSDKAFSELVQGSTSIDEYEKGMRNLLGTSGFVSFARVPHGDWSEKSGNKVDCFLFVLGNPLFAKPMLDLNPQVGLYVPPRLLVYLHEDGFAHVRFDSLEETLRDLGDERILPHARVVDDKLKALATMN